MTIDSQIPRLEIRNISKQFPGILANDGISLSVRAGEIHALLGENGAGKSTLMNIVYGLLQPDSGEIYLDNQLLKLQSPRDAIKHSIGMVHQHFMLIPKLSVAENIILGMRPFTQHLLDIRSIEKELSITARQYGMKINPSAIVNTLSVGEQQRVEIVKALYRGVSLLILDEPTAVLTPQETNELFDTLHQLTEKGLSIIFITHKLNEVMQTADRVSVLRDGRLIVTKNVADTNKEELAYMMVNRDVAFTLDRTHAEARGLVLKVKDLVVRGKTHQAVNKISFEVNGGEILGVAGVDGNGQHELALALTGLIPPDSGKIFLNGQDVTHKSVRHLNEAGLGHIPADRQEMGSVLDFSIADNLILREYYRSPYTSRFGIFNPRMIANNAQQLIRKFDIRTRNAQTKLGHLSGGNQQKVILARELNQNPLVLVAVQPTRGLDIGATEYIHKLLLEQRARGAAIVLISTELDEIFALSDRIAVIYEGNIVGEMSGKNPNIQKIGRMMGGVAI
jgi:ABC-type uncharacterized transport system ATPase subunit